MASPIGCLGEMGWDAVGQSLPEAVADLTQCFPGGKDVIVLVGGSFCFPFSPPQC